MDGFLTPELVVIFLSIFIFSSIIAATFATIYNDEGLRNMFRSIKQYFVVSKMKNRKKVRKKTTLSPLDSTRTSRPKSSSKPSWEDGFTVNKPLNRDGTINASVAVSKSRKLGSCDRCHFYTAKRQCRWTLRLFAKLRKHCIPKPLVVLHSQTLPLLCDEYALVDLLVVSLTFVRKLLFFRHNACGKCCRGDPASVCSAHGTGYQAATDELNNAIECGYLEVDISYSNLKICPPRMNAIGSFVTCLNLSNNRLSSIPKAVGSISGLRELFLQYNNLTRLPDSICKLSNLVELDVKSNSITVLPTDIGALKHLNVLCLMNNLLIRLPTSVGQLRNLQELSLHSNNLKLLPDQLCHVKSLKALFCGENKLTDVPANIGNLTQLEELDLTYNSLTSLPHSLCSCKHLTRLWLTNNKLQQLPSQIGLLKNLKELHVRKNCLKYFPYTIIDLHFLYTFSAQHNPVLRENQTERLNHTPTESFPSLLELAARSVSVHNITFSRGEIPYNLDDMLTSGYIQHCSKCGRRVFQYYSSRVVFKLVGVYYRLPLYEVTCSPHSNNGLCIR